MTDTSLPVETRIGHVHLKVADLDRAISFYRDILGFDLLFNLGTAAFLSAGGYHHHIGLNTWQSRDGKPTPAGHAGLEKYVIAIPTQQGLQEVKARLVAHNVPFEEQGSEIQVKDPWGNVIVLKVQA